MFTNAVYKFFYQFLFTNFTYKFLFARSVILHIIRPIVSGQR